VRSFFFWRNLWIGTLGRFHSATLEGLYLVIVNWRGLGHRWHDLFHPAAVVERCRWDVHKHLSKPEFFEPRRYHQPDERW